MSYLQLALVLGSGVIAREVFDLRHQTNCETTVIGLSGEISWLHDVDPSIATLNPADLASLTRTLRSGNFTHISFVGGPFNSLSSRDIVLFLLSRIMWFRKVGHKSLPNSFFDLVLGILSENSVQPIHVADILPTLVCRERDFCGAHGDQRLDGDEWFDDAWRAWSVRTKSLPAGWHRHRCIYDVESGEVFYELRGITELLARFRRGRSSGRAGILVVGNLPKYEAVNVPAIDFELVRKCHNAGLLGIVAESERVLVAQKDEIFSYVQTEKFRLTFRDTLQL